MKSFQRTTEEIVQAYERHIRTVYKVCFMFMKNMEDTEDVVQATFVKLMEYKGTFNDIEHEKAWLIVTASNLCKDILRKWWRKNVSIDNIFDTKITTTIKQDETPLCQ